MDHSAANIIRNIPGIIYDVRDCCCGNLRPMGDFSHSWHYPSTIPPAELPYVEANGLRNRLLSNFILFYLFRKGFFLGRRYSTEIKERLVAVLARGLPYQTRILGPWSRLLRNLRLLTAERYNITNGRTWPFMLLPFTSPHLKERRHRRFAGKATNICSAASGHFLPMLYSRGCASLGP